VLHSPPSWIWGGEGREKGGRMGGEGKRRGRGSKGEGRER